MNVNVINKDIEQLINKIECKYQYKDYKSFFNNKKNIMFVNRINGISEIELKKEQIINEQINIDKKIDIELEKIDSLNIPIIGLKGVFVKDSFYKNIPRTSNDIDLLVESKNISVLYKCLKKVGYSIELKTLYDFPHIKMKVSPKKYIENTQTLMLINKTISIPIDIHNNLNITNAHFKKSNTSFNTQTLIENSKPFKNYKNIRVLEMHDNLCFLFRHIMKHHVFYGKTQSGLHTFLQRIVDIATIINSNGFDEKKLLEKCIEYNIVPEAIYCINLYNKLFVSFKKVDLNNYLKMYYCCKYKYRIKWERILFKSLEMPIENLIIGDFNESFPKLQKAVNFSNSLPLYYANWFVQGFIINSLIEKLI